LKTITIDGKTIGEGYPVFIIAELSANHHQDFTLAKEAIKLAKEAGADAIKLQTYTADSLTIDVKDEQFKAGFLWSSEYLYDLYQRASMPYEWHEPLKVYADELGIILFSSPFDLQGVDLLEKLSVPAYKIASFEITDIPLIDYVARKGKPIIISTGIANNEDINLAIKTCHDAGNEHIILLKCTSKYPASPESMNLNTIPDMAKRFKTVIGLSDHTLGSEACITAVALGAKVIEKHFTPDASIPSADQAFSLNPTQFANMVQSVRTVEKMLGTPNYEGGSKRFSRSLYATEDIQKGELFTPHNIRSIRPGFGLHPKYFVSILGQRAQQSIKRGTPLSFDLIEEKS
jgi:pseudaminic acid synthase